MRITCIIPIVTNDEIVKSEEVVPHWMRSLDIVPMWVKEAADFFRRKFVDGKIVRQTPWIEGLFLRCCVRGIHDADSKKIFVVIFFIARLLNFAKKFPFTTCNYNLGIPY